MAPKPNKQQGFSHILLLVAILVVATVAGFAYIRIKNASKKNTSKTSSTTATTTTPQSNTTNNTPSTNIQTTTDGPMALDENTFAGWGLKFVGDKTKASNIIIVPSVDGNGNPNSAYGYYDNETTGANGGIVVRTRKKESKPSGIIAVTKDLIDYGKTLKTKDEKIDFSNCITSPFGGWIVFWNQQQYEKDLADRAQYSGGPGHGEIKPIGSAYVYYQQATGGCGYTDAAMRVQENIKSTTNYVMDNLKPL